MTKKSMFQRIKNLKRLGYSKYQARHELGLDKKTIKKYWGMSDEEYYLYHSSLHYREKEFDIFREEIITIYRENDYIRIPVSSVYDFLEENHERLPATENSLRNYIQYLEATGAITFSEQIRYFTKVPEMPYGKQVQIDFGIEKNGRGGKYYIFAAVLSASRFKYASLQENPFTTRDLIDHLLDCFDYFHGMPEELVIDQDSIMVVDENHGDIIYTKDFDDFIKEMDLIMRVCRKADPQSKGKIENFIKYIKHNFFAFRKFAIIDEARERLMKWLERRANGKISQATKKVPLIEIEEERKHLRAIRNSIYRKGHMSMHEERLVSDKSRITVETCQYDLPEKYCNKTVEIYKTSDTLFVFDSVTGEQIAEHSLSLIPGKVVKNQAIKREMGARVRDLKNEVLGYFVLDSWKEFLETNFKIFPRYARDQCLEARRYFKDRAVDVEMLDNALRYCIENKTVSVSNLKDSYMYFLDEQKVSIENGRPDKVILELNGAIRIASSIEVSKPDLAPYQSLLSNSGGGE